MTNRLFVDKNQQNQVALITTRPRFVSQIFSFNQMVTEKNHAFGELTQVEQTELGITEIICPTLELENKSNAAEEIHLWLKNLHQKEDLGLVVFVSPGALLLLRNFFPKSWPQTLRVGLMGSGSASCAMRLGIPHEQLIYPNANLGYSQDANGLCRVLNEFNNRHHEKSITPLFKSALILKGPRGRNTIAQQLKALNIAVKSLEAYDRRIVSSVEIQGLLKPVYQSYQIIVFYVTSSESANHLIHVIDSDPLFDLRSDQRLNMHMPFNSNQATTKILALATHPKVAQTLVKCNKLTVNTIEPGRLALLNYFKNHFVK